MTHNVTSWHDEMTREELVEYCEALMMECDDLRAQLNGDVIPQYSDFDYDELNNAKDVQCASKAE